MAVAKISIPYVDSWPTYLFCSDFAIYLLTYLFVYICVSLKLIGRHLRVPFTAGWMLKCKHSHRFKNNM